MTEWALLRERWAISRQIEDLPEPIPAEQLRAVHDRIRGLERFRTPKTAEYIDLVRLILMDQTPNDRARVDAAADRLMELEREWVKKARLPVKLVRRDKV
jgi:hypothetical protein